MFLDFIIELSPPWEGLLHRGPYLLQIHTFSLFVSHKTYSTNAGSEILEDTGPLQDHLIFQASLEGQNTDGLEP